jgi:hypothetical protein
MNTRKIALARLACCDTWVDSKIAVYDIVATWREAGLGEDELDESLTELRQSLQAIADSPSNLRAVQSSRWSLEILDELQCVR